MAPTRRVSAMVGLPLAATLLVAATGSGTAGRPEARSARTEARRLVIGVRGDVTSLNIYTAASAFDQEIADLLYPRLAYEEDDFQQGPPTFRPGLASSWDLSPDGTSLTFHLDRRGSWSDGRPVTAADVLLSHRAASSPDVAWAGIDSKEFIQD